MKIEKLWLVVIMYNAKENAVTMLLFAMHVTRRVAQVAARDFKSRASQLVRLSRHVSLECCVTITQTMAAKSKPPTCDSLQLKCFYPML